MSLAKVKPPMNIPPAPPPPLITPAGQPVVHIPGGIPENWPSFEKCPQLDLGLMRMACVTYPWEKDDYNFDFESVYPPIPDDFPEWVKKIVELTKYYKIPPQPGPREDCPFCPRFPNPIEDYKVMDHEAWMKDHDFDFKSVYPPIPDDFDYNFDFESVYPPVPDDCPEWVKKIVKHAKHYKIPQPRPREDCPFCPRFLHPIEGYKVMDHEAWMKDHECAWHVATYHLWNSKYDGQLPCLIKPEDLERTKRYLRQLRNTRGYDIDCYPHPSLVPNRLCIGDQDMVDSVEAMLQEEYGVIAHITKKTEKLYKLKKVHKVVWWGYFTYLVTFSAIDVGEGSEEKFLATFNDKTILECLRHPLVDAPMPDIPECAICPADIPYPFRGENLSDLDLCISF